jgi:hypothetical protein
MKGSILVVTSKGKNNSYNYIQIYGDICPDSSGFWIPIKRNNGAVVAWRYYYENPEDVLKMVGVYPPPIDSYSSDGGATWKPTYWMSMRKWINGFKGGESVKWRIEREFDKVIARLSE